MSIPTYTPATVDIGGSMAPSWAETSVRWVREKHPGRHVPRHSKLPFDKILLNLLISVKYLKFEMVDTRSFSEAKWKQSLGNMVAVDGSPCWNSTKHRMLVKFLDDGGYEALRTETGGGLEPVYVGTDKEGRLEVIELELELDELEDAIAADPVSKKAQVSPRHELDDVVAEGVLQLDPRFGAW